MTSGEAQRASFTYAVQPIFWTYTEIWGRFGIYYCDRDFELELGTLKSHGRSVAGVHSFVLS